MASRRSAKTAKERKAWMDSDPKKEFGQKYVDLAEEFSGTESSYQLLMAALNKGTGKAKSTASNQLLELAAMDSGTLKSEGILITLAQSGSPDAQKKASEQILELASANPTSDSASRLLNGMLEVRGKSEGKTKAALMLIDQIDSDIRSNKSADTLIKIATSAEGEAQTAALSRLTEHHLNNAGILGVMTRLSRGAPNEASEKWLKEVCRKATDGKIKSNAAISLSNVISRRDTYRSLYGDAEPEVRERLDKKLLAYLDKTPAPNEMDLIDRNML